MGNGQFGVYFVGSGASTEANRSDGGPNAPRDYERVLYKVGRFPNGPESATHVPSNCLSPETGKGVPPKKSSTHPTRVRSKSVGAERDKNQVAYIGTKPYDLNSKSVFEKGRAALGSCGAYTNLNFNGNNNIDIAGRLNLGQTNGSYLSYNNFRLGNSKSTPIPLVLDCDVRSSKGAGGRGGGFGNGGRSGNGWGGGHGANGNGWGGGNGGHGNGWGGGNGGNGNGGSGNGWGGGNGGSGNGGSGNGWGGGNGGNGNGGSGNAWGGGNGNGSGVAGGNNAGMGGENDGEGGNGGGSGRGSGNGGGGGYGPDDNPNSSNANNGSGRNGSFDNPNANGSRNGSFQGNGGRNSVGENMPEGGFMRPKGAQTDPSPWLPYGATTDNSSNSPEIDQGNNKLMSVGRNSNGTGAGGMPGQLNGTTSPPYGEGYNYNLPPLVPLGPRVGSNEWHYNANSGSTEELQQPYPNNKSTTAGSGPHEPRHSIGNARKPPYGTDHRTGHGISPIPEETSPDGIDSSHKKKSIKDKETDPGEQGISGAVGVVRSEPPNPFGMPRLFSTGYPKLRNVSSLEDSSNPPGGRGGGGRSNDPNSPFGETGTKRVSSDNYGEGVGGGSNQPNLWDQGEYQRRSTKSSEDIRGRRDSNQDRRPSQQNISPYLENKGLLKRNGANTRISPARTPPDRNLRSISDVPKKKDWVRPWYSASNMHKSEPNLSLYARPSPEHRFSDPLPYGNTMDSNDRDGSGQGGRSGPKTRRHPSDDTQGEGPVLGARKQSVQKLRNDLNSQQYQGDDNPSSSGGYRTPKRTASGKNRRPRELGLLPLTSPSTLSLKRLMEGQITPIKRTKTKQERESMLEDVDDRVVGMLNSKTQSHYLMHNQSSRAGILQTALRKPEQNNSQTVNTGGPQNAARAGSISSHTNQGQQPNKKRSIRFKGVPPTPPPTPPPP